MIISVLQALFFELGGVKILSEVCFCSYLCILKLIITVPEKQSQSISKWLALGK